MKQKLFYCLFFLFSLLGGQKANAQTLAAGDIAFVGYHTDADDGFTFITLKAIPGGEVIYFTDKGWNTTGNTWYANSEDHIIWSSPGGGLPIGTVVSIIETSDDTFTVSQGTAVLSGTDSDFSLLGGDSILAYQSSSGAQPANPTFIAGIYGDDNYVHTVGCDDAGGWLNCATCTHISGTCSTTGSDTSGLPASLTNGLNAVALFPSSGEADNAFYSGTLTGTVSTILAAINNPTNWISSDDPINIYSTQYSGINITPDAPACVNPAITSNPPNRIICVGSNTTFTVTATGATSYKWQLNAGSGFTDITNGGVYSGATTATLTITGATAGMNGYLYRAVAMDGACSTISNSGSLTVANISISYAQVNSTCFGGSNGAAAVAANNGVAPYSYSWTPYGGTSNVAIGLVAGVYTVTVTDAIGCTGTHTFTITQPASGISFTQASQTDVSCYGGANGALTINTPTGGAGGYAYDWTPGNPVGDGTTSVSGLTAGDWTVTVTDANFCTTSQTFKITQPTQLIATGVLDSNVSVNGGADGAATASGTGGTAPYAYVWNNGATTASITGLLADTYTVTIFDANGCTGTTSVNVTEPAVLIASGIAGNVNCNGGNDGTIDLTVTGGTSPYTYEWDNEATTEDLSDLAVGTYSVTVTDANGHTATTSVTITEPTVLSASTDLDTNVSCNGGSNGSATVNATGGTAPYRYAWSNGDITASITGLVATTYTVTVTDANGCTTSASVTITEPTAVNLSLSLQTNIDCNGEATGSARVTATGGTAPYTYLWNDTSAQTTITATGLAAGTYQATVTDAKGCSATTSVTITQYSAILADFSADQVFGCGPLTVNFTDASSGGNTPFTTWSWDFGDGTTSDLQNPSHVYTSSGAFTVSLTVSNSYGCSKTKIKTNYIQVIGPDVDFEANNTFACEPGLTVAFSDLTIAYSPVIGWNWNFGDGQTSTLQNPSHTYTTNGSFNVSLTVSDLDGCSKTETKTAYINISTLNITSVSKTNVSCNGGSNGSATVNVTGGTAPYSYEWDNAATTASIAGVVAGTYHVTVTDANGCTAIASVTITEPAAMVVAESIIGVVYEENFVQGQSYCSGNSQYDNWGIFRSNLDPDTNYGSLTISGSEAPGGITLTDPVVISQIVAALHNGTSLSVTSEGHQWRVDIGCYDDISSCGFVQDAVELSVDNNYSCSCGNGFSIRPCIQNLNWGGLGENCDAVTQSMKVEFKGSIKNVSCSGGNDGTITADVRGGTAPYTYEWDNDATTASITDLAVGTYQVTVTDANGCKGFQNYTITEPTVLSASIVVDANVSCNGTATGSATVNVTGGTAPYSYEWDNAATTASIAGAVAGTYNVTVTDANGCTAMTSVIITEPAALSASTVIDTNVSCNGTATGSATVAANGGTAPYSYEWDNDAATASIAGVVAGTYNVTVTDANGCTATASVTITKPTVLSAAISSQTNILCSGGSNGSATVAANGGTAPYTYEWDNAAATASISDVVAGTYNVTVTDANGCSATASVTITEPTVLSASTVIDTNVSCNGTATGSATVAANGGTAPYSYEWDNAATTASIAGAVAGTYHVTVTDANGCTAMTSITITEPTVLSAAISSQTNILCSGGSNGSATVAANGGTTPYTYVWSNAPTTASISGVVAGTYNVTVTDANGCTAMTSVTITEPTVLSAAISSQTNILCSGGSNGSATVAANGGTAPYTYVWSNAATTASISGVVAGTYNVTVTDANGCTAMTSVTITEPTVLVAATVVDTNVSCNGTATGSATVNVTGGTAPYSYEWDNDATTASIADAVAGTYNVTVTDANGCTAMTSVTITEPTLLSAAISSQTNVSCNGGSNGSATVNVTGGTSPYTYEWSNGDTTASIAGVVAGTYNVTVTDANGCTATASVTITKPTVLSAAISSQTNILCSGGSNGSATVAANGGTAPYSYEWDNDATTVSIAGVVAGTYTVTVTDANGCSATASVTITEPTVLSASTTVDTNVWCNGTATGSATVNVTGGTAPYSYEWDNATATASIAGVVAGTYHVIVTDAKGCTAMTSVTITEPAVLVATAVQDFPATCTENTDGGATVSVTGGVTPYTYEWDNDATTTVVTNLSVGNHTVTITDANGCTITANLTIDFNDTEAPVPTLANLAEITAECIVNQSDVPVPTATDNCSGTITVTHDVVFPITLQGTTVITWRYEDVNGNTTTQTQNVVIEDTSAPVADIATLADISMQCQVLSTDIPVPTATDNCTGVLTATTSDPLFYTTSGTYTITWTYDDGNGNTATQTQSITVTDSSIDAVTFTDQSVVYNTTAQSIEVSNLPVGATVDYSIVPDTGLGNAAIAAGVYTVTAVVTPADDAPNCSPVTLTATLSIDKAAQDIIFDALPIKNLESDPDFQLSATATSGLPVYYTYTFSTADPAATVTADGFVAMLTSGIVQITAHQDGDANYLATTPVEQQLEITSSDAVIRVVTIGDTEYENPGSDIYNLMLCEDTGKFVTVSLETEVGATVTPGHTFTIDTPEPGLYHQTVTVTSQDGTTTQTYTITVEKRFQFFDIAIQKFDNLLLANDNPQTNGGYSFVKYEWYKNNQLVSRDQYFSEGPTSNDLLDPNAEYYLKLTTAEGDVLQTCVSGITLEHNYKMSIHPNPARIGSEVIVTVDFPSSEINDMRIDIYDLHGKIIHTSRSSHRITPVQLPNIIEEGMYIVMCTTQSYQKSFKIIVRK